VTTTNVQYDSDKPFPSGGLTLPTTHLTWINHTTTFCILNFILREKDVYLLLYSVLLTQKVVPSLGGLQPKWPLVLRSLPSPPCIL